MVVGELDPPFLAKLEHGVDQPCPRPQEDLAVEGHDQAVWRDRPAVGLQHLVDRIADPPCHEPVQDARNKRERADDADDHAAAPDAFFTLVLTVMRCSCDCSDTYLRQSGKNSVMAMPGSSVNSSFISMAWSSRKKDSTDT